MIKPFTRSANATKTSNRITLGRRLSLISLLSLSLYMVPAFAEDYYRWVGEDGVTHYGSTPPQGVEAVKVKTYGGQNTTAPSAAQEGNGDTEAVDIEEDLPPEEIARRAKLAEKQAEMCNAEKDRLAVLEKNGRIRMKESDGSFRYMTQAEIQAEIATSKNIMADVCSQ